MKHKGHFVISLDFELLWGVFDQVSPFQKQLYFQNTRNIIPEMLEVFQEFELHATWATVGMLFNKNWKEWEINKPQKFPGYVNERLSPYVFKENIEYETLDAMCFAPEIIKQILTCPGQEIGTHTYSHYYCQEEGQTPGEFKVDMEQAVKLSASFGINLQSLVFPRNQLKEEYLKICFDLGIKNVRSNPSSWYWVNTRSNSIYTKLARTGDAYLSLGKKSYPLSQIVKKPGLPIEQKASRFYRPLEANSFLRSFKLKRIKQEMTYAAKNNEVYHLWWHPHNFGDNPKESLADLRKIAEHYAYLKCHFNFQSRNMIEISNLVS